MTTTEFGPDASASYATGIRASQPSLRFDGLTNALLSVGAAKMLWGTSFSGIPRDATVTAASYFDKVAANASGSINVQLALNDDGFDTATTWDTAPGTTGTAVTQTLSSPVAGDWVEYDVTALVQAAVAAGEFNGWQTSVTSGADLSIVMGESYATVEWTQTTEKATGLSPNGIVGVQKPLLSGFPKDTQAVRVQVDATGTPFNNSTGFGSPDWSSGTTSVDAPEFDLALSSYPGAGIGIDQYWTVSTQGSDGNWSQYSDPVIFTYVPLVALTITGPSAAFPYVTDPSPTFTWTFSGQVAYRVYVTLVGDGDKTIIWDTKRVLSSIHSVTMPKGYLKDRKQYRVWVEGFPTDYQDRVAVPGADIFQRSAQVFTFQEVGGVPPVTYLSVTQVSTSPVLEAVWFRTAGSPDQWTVWVDDVVYESGIDPGDVADVDTGGWKLRLYGLDPNVSHTVYVEAVVNGDSSVPGPMQTLTPVTSGDWLIDGDRDLMVLLINTSDSFGAQDQAVVAQPVGSRAKVRRTSAVAYLEGGLQGTIADDALGTTTAAEFEHDMVQIKAKPWLPVTYYGAGRSFLCQVSNVKIGDDPERVHPERAGVEMWVEQIGDQKRFTDAPAFVDGTMPDPDVEYRWDDAADGSAITVGQADVDATAGSPVRHHSGTLAATSPDHTGIYGWSGGSITRSLDNPNSFTREYYGTVPTSLSSSWSNFTVKNPGSSPNQPCDIRWRTGGTIDMKVQDGSIPDSCNLQWKSFSGKAFRSLLRVVWNPDTSTYDVDYWLTFDYHIEDQQPQTEMHASFVADEPVNISTGSGGVTNVMVELERGWWTALYPNPFGAELPTPPLKSLDLRAGHASQTTIEVAGSVWGTDATAVSGSDLMGCNLSTNSGMTSPTQLGAAVRDSGGFRRWQATGLTANTSYYFQLTKNGTPVGSVHGPIKTLKTIGSTVTIKHAVGGCQQGKPGIYASQVAFADAVAWGADAFIHLGDDTYSDDLDTNVTTHQKWYTTSMVDPALQLVQQAMAVNKVISDHDCNGGSTPQGNAPNYNDPVTTTSLTAWASSVPATMADVRTPKRARYTSHVEGNFRFVYLDTRSLDRTDVLSLPDYNAGVYDPRRDPASTMLGNSGTGNQLTWLKAEIDAASLAGQLLVIYTDPGWNGEAAFDDSGVTIAISNSDKWVSYIYERDLISDYIVSSYAAHGKTPNAVIVHSDTHAIQWDAGTHEKNGLKVICAGPFDQNIHALQTFFDNYDFTYPSNANAPGRLPQKEMYFRITYSQSGGVATVTPVAMNCTPKDVGSTPTAITGGSPTPWTYTL